LHRDFPNSFLVRLVSFAGLALPLARRLSLLVELFAELRRYHLAHLWDADLVEEVAKETIVSISRDMTEHVAGIRLREEFLDRDAENELALLCG
jgi:hypothetical protein